MSYSLLYILIQPMKSKIFFWFALASVCTAYISYALRPQVVYDEDVKVVPTTKEAIVADVKHEEIK